MTSLKDNYHYTLPPELIAKQPAEPRDAARLFVYDTNSGKIQFDVFKNIAHHLPIPSLLVLNDTKVYPARVVLRKETGGKVETLLFVDSVREGDQLIRGLVDRRVEKNQRLFFNGEHFLTVAGQDNQIFSFRYNFGLKPLLRLLEKKGYMPIPKYLKGTPLFERQLRRRYQSVFARKSASIAAPTATLHFTDRLLRSLSRAGVDHVFTSLNIGLGTFAPLNERNLKTGKLHPECYEIPAASVKKIADVKKIGGAVVAVGTTMVRALESTAVSLLRGRESGLSGSTELFIRPPYNFRVVDALITNFHLPGSSLMYLVDAFLLHKHAPRRILDLYKIAVRERFRFYSFGDAMFIR